MVQAGWQGGGESKEQVGRPGSWSRQTQKGRVAEAEGDWGRMGVGLLERQVPD